MRHVGRGEANWTFGPYRANPAELPHITQTDLNQTIGGEQEKPYQMVTKPSNQTSAASEPKAEEQAESAETPAITPFEAAVLKGCEALNEYSVRISDEVDKARVWDDKLNPAMWPIRDLMSKIGANAANKPLMDAPVISDMADVLDRAGSTADFRTFVATAAEIAQKVQPAEISTEAPEAVIKAESDLKGVLDNSLIALMLAESVQTTAKAALDAFAAAEKKRREYALASKRAVPSKTGTKGASEAKGEQKLQVAFMSENGLSTYSTRNGEQEVSKAGHAIKEKLAESRGFGADLSKLPEADKKAINDTLRDLAENGHTGQMVQVPGIGTFTKK